MMPCSRRISAVTLTGGVIPSFIHQRAPLNKVNNKRWPQLPVQCQLLSAPKINMLLDCQYIIIVHLQQKPSQENWLQALGSLGISGSGFLPL